MRHFRHEAGYTPDRALIYHRNKLHFTLIFTPIGNLE